MALYWFEKPDTTPSYAPSIRWYEDGEGKKAVLKHSCCMCGDRLQFDFAVITRGGSVAAEMVRQGWCHPGPGVSLCSKEACRAKCRKQMQ